MPEYLKAFLSGLTDEQADETCLYFDGCDNMELIDLIADSHPNIKAQIDLTAKEWNSEFGPGPIL